ncbi:helix-turn-helix domain-containing protein [Chitinophaga defluvii]|uniref:AraC family transcriptional regulator n=1 Tax=Chitinophaga defluvii TaxID=3163343 RepID=A0ABV2T420_9BACT
MENYHKYLHISPQEEAWDFYVTTAGYNKTNKNDQYPDKKRHPQDHSFSWNKGRILDGYYIVFITSGQGIFESAETAPKIINEGSCFILFPGIWHRYKPDPKFGWEEYWVGFKGPYPEKIMNRFFSAGHPFVDTGFNKELLSAFVQLLKTISESQIGYQQIVSGITLQILGILNTTSIHEKLNSDPESVWVSKVMFKLQTALDRQVHMETLIAEFPVSYSKFRSSFKRLVGKSPNQYHLYLRLKKSAELLTNTTLTISEIAYQTGFESLYYFSRLFKKKYGVSPKQYRL